MSILNQWFALPFNVQRKLATEFKIKDYGTTESQLIFELQTKLPKGLLKEAEIETVVVKPAEIKKTKEVEEEKEIKEVKVKKTKKSK